MSTITSAAEKITICVPNDINSAALLVVVNLRQEFDIRVFEEANK